MNERNEPKATDPVASTALFGGFFVQARSGNDAEWTTLGKVEKTRERAKRHAKEHLEGCRAVFQSRCEYRLIINDARWTIDQESKPPHGWRMRWVDTPTFQANAENLALEEKS